MNNQCIRFLEDLTLNNLKTLLAKGAKSELGNNEIDSTLTFLAGMPASSLTGVYGVSVEVTYRNETIRLYFIATKAKSATTPSINKRFSIKDLGIKKAFEPAVLKRAELIGFPLMVNITDLTPPTGLMLYKEAVDKKGIDKIEASGIPKILGLE